MAIADTGNHAITTITTNAIGNRIRSPNPIGSPSAQTVVAHSGAIGVMEVMGVIGVTVAGNAESAFSCWF